MTTGNGVTVRLDKNDWIKIVGLAVTCVVTLVGAGWAGWLAHDRKLTTMETKVEQKVVDVSNLQNRTGALEGRVSTIEGFLGRERKDP